MQAFKSYKIGGSVFEFSKHFDPAKMIVIIRLRSGDVRRLVLEAVDAFNLRCDLRAGMREVIEK